MEKLKCEVAVIGGSLGGIAAAWALLRHKRRVILTGEYAWLGGQATSQAVPPDENKYIETISGTASYRQWRKQVRDYYRRNYPLKTAFRDRDDLNPGGGSVSLLCHEPKVSAAVFEALLAPYQSSGQLRVLTGWVPVSAELAACRLPVVETPSDSSKSRGRLVRQVTLRHLTDDEKLCLEADYFLDATELGELLPLTQTEYVCGAEAQSDTGELHALPQADPQDIQSLTWCFAVSREKQGSFVIPKPAAFDSLYQRRYPFWPGSLFSWVYNQPISLQPEYGTIDGEAGKRDLWTYRRIFSGGMMAEGNAADITLVNWPQNDYWGGSIIDVPETLKQRHLEESRQLSLSFLYWLQTAAPRADGRRGYPELRLRGDSLGTADGLAQAPYIRESRRILPLKRVTEADVGYDMRQQINRENRPEAKQFSDSVGIGYYRIDLHPSTGGRNYVDIQSLPFQIPLGALIPRHTANLLPACKNIGTTHITNGCYRLHPVEWNIGEVSGLLADFCLHQHCLPMETDREPARLLAFQQLLCAEGITLAWLEHLRAGL
ncbi:FAD-dependent oxidoreductase [Oscillospiraceae bacterium HV4-5-C5C]|nr:FAD-dependent oxidoreductase [Oscillospiraceae bacterium HV4-5-C5C]